MRYLRYLTQAIRQPIIWDRISTTPISNDFGLSRGTPIDRYYIESFLKENEVDIKGTALEDSEFNVTLIKK